MKQLLICSLLLLAACDGWQPPEPVICLNKQSLQVIEGVRYKSNQGMTYIDYVDAAGFDKRITDKDSEQWLCAKPEDLENESAAPISQT